MRLKKRTLRALSAAISLLFLLPASGCKGEEESVRTEITFTSSSPVYGSGVKTRLGEKLHTAVGEALLSTKGAQIANVWTKNALAKALLVNLGSSFERRGVPLEEYRSAVEGLCGKKELLCSLFAGDKGAVEPFATLFGEIAANVGNERAALIAYDFLLDYCQYNHDDFTAKYDNPNYDYEGIKPHLKAEAAKWATRKEGAKTLGEENFSVFLRFWLSALSVFSLRAGEGGTASAILSATYPGEAALFLRTQGEILEKLRMTEGDYLFVFEFLGEVGKIDLFAAILKANKGAEYASRANGLMQAVSIALSATDESAAALLLEGKTEEYIRVALSALSEEEREKAEAFFAVENAPQSYREYFEENKIEGFEGYKRENVKSEAEGYLYDRSPELAFLVFGR